MESKIALSLHLFFLLSFNIVSSAETVAKPIEVDVGTEPGLPQSDIQATDIIEEILKPGDPVNPLPPDVQTIEAELMKSGDPIGFQPDVQPLDAEMLKPGDVQPPEDGMLKPGDPVDLPPDVQPPEDGMLKPGDPVDILADVKPLEAEMLKPGDPVDLLADVKPLDAEMLKSGDTIDLRPDIQPLEAEILKLGDVVNPIPSIDAVKTAEIPDLNLSTLNAVLPEKDTQPLAMATSFIEPQIATIDAPVYLKPDPLSPVDGINTASKLPTNLADLLGSQVESVQLANIDPAVLPQQIPYDLSKEELEKIVLASNISPDDQLKEVLSTSDIKPNDPYIADKNLQPDQPKDVNVAPQPAVQPVYPRIKIPEASVRKPAVFHWLEDLGIMKSDSTVATCETSFKGKKGLGNLLLAFVSKIGC